MGKYFTPINNLRTRRMRQEFGGDTLDAIIGECSDDEFTYTTRITVSEPERRELIRRRILEQAPAEAKRLLKVLDDNEWDVSFFVDTF